METSTPESARLASSRNKTLETLENWPFTLAFHVGHHYVLDLELGNGVSRINLPGSVGVCDAASVAATRFKLSILLISCLSLSIYLVSSCCVAETHESLNLCGLHPPFSS
jgi:hypothetical protein